MRTRMLLATIAALAVTACSNGDDATPTTTTTAAPTTTASTTSTTSTSTTTTSSTTTTTTRPPTTESTPPTTEPRDEIQEVIDGFQAAWRAFDAAKLDPTNDATVDAARALFSGDSLAALNERVEQFRNENLRGVTNPDVPARADVYQDSVTIQGDVATLLVCDVNSNMLVEVGAAPDGSDAIVNDDIVARLIDTTMIRSSGGWLLAGGTTTAEYFGQDRCEEM